MKRIQRTNLGVCLVVAFLLAAALPVSAGLVDVTVRFEPAERTVNVGDDFTVNVVADINPPVVGWGLDVNAVTPMIISPVGLPTIGSAWIPAYAPDGDGLAGLAFPDSVSGAGVLLATLTFHADAIGETDLLAGVTPGDGTEGFALDPTGSAITSFEPAHLIVIPEPATALLVCVLVGPFARRRTLSATGSTRSQ
jgi:hypothetical protein